MRSALKRSNKTAERNPREEAIWDLTVRVLSVPPDRYQNLMRANVPEWDSLKHMELVFALEDEFGVRFDEAEFPALSSPSAIAKIIAKHLATRP